MNKQIEQILNDLYALDEDFRQHENHLRNIVGDLLSAKPDIKINDNFISQLRIKLLDKAEVLEKKQFNFSDIAGYFRFFNRLPYILGSAVLLLAVGIFAGVYFTGDLQPVKTKVAQLEEKAFGPLSTLSGQKQEGGIDQESAAPTARPMERGISKEASFQQDVRIGPMEVYKYIYKGGEFTVPADKMPVYKPVRSSQGPAFADILSKFDFNGVDLGKFSQAKIENLNLTEDRKFGYVITINFKEGLFSLYKNWEKWPRYDIERGIPTMPPCEGEVCAYGKPHPYSVMPLSDMPSDEEILNIANNFLREYGIDTVGYGQGKVQHYGRLAYTPEEITVVYPFLINGKTVFNQGGNENGLTIGVDVRQKKVSYLSNLRMPRYESSLYEVERDGAKILKFAEQGGDPYYYISDRYLGDVKIIEIPLGTPSLGLVANWKYDNVTGRGYELYVPAFVFPILELPSENPYFFRKNVVVPIVKDLMDSIFFIKPVPMPIMPPTGDY